MILSIYFTAWGYISRKQKETNDNLSQKIGSSHFWTKKAAL